MIVYRSVIGREQQNEVPILGTASKGAAEAARKLGRESTPPLSQGKSPKWRDSFFSEYLEEVSYPRIATWQAVRTEHWKYIHYPYLAGMDELYDVKEDKLEMKNRINDPAAQGALKEAKLEFARLRKASGTGELEKK
jgi:N-acetylglucosamine-6-sulfatase